MISQFENVRDFWLEILCVANSLFDILRDFESCRAVDMSRQNGQLLVRQVLHDLKDGIAGGLAAGVGSPVFPPQGPWRYPRQHFFKGTVIEVVISEHEVDGALKVLRQEIQVPFQHRCFGDVATYCQSIERLTCQVLKKRSQIVFRHDGFRTGPTKQRQFRQKRIPSCFRRDFGGRQEHQVKVDGPGKFHAFPRSVLTRFYPDNLILQPSGAVLNAPVWAISAGREQSFITNLYHEALLYAR